MPRLHEVPRADTTPEVQRIYDLIFGKGRDPVADPGTDDGTPGNWWTVVAGNPDVLQHCMGGFVLYRSSVDYLDPQLRELGQTRTGYARGSTFVFSQHSKAMRSHGFTEEQIAAIPYWSIADCWTPIQRAVLAYTDCLVLEGGRVPEAIFDALEAELDDRAILALTYVTLTYDLHATMTKALRMEYDDRDDPVAEQGQKVKLKGIFGGDPIPR